MVEDAPVPVSAPTTNTHDAARFFSAAMSGALMGDWSVLNKSADAELVYNLATIRARSRDFARNNTYFQRFLRLLEINVVGEEGFTLQCKSQDINGKLDTFANTLIETQWYEWSKYGNCTMCRDFSLKGLLGVIVKAIARDGEIFLRIIHTFGNKWTYALQVLDADYCPITKNETLSNGNKIRMGKEYDKYGACVAYYMYTEHPGDDPYSTHVPDSVRIPADEIIHIYIKERPQQGRGIPWIAGATTNLRHLQSFIEAELVATRAGASQAGWIKTPFRC